MCKWLNEEDVDVVQCVMMSCSRGDFCEIYMIGCSKISQNPGKNRTVRSIMKLIFVIKSLRFDDYCMCPVVLVLFQP